MRRVLVSIFLLLCLLPVRGFGGQSDSPDWRQIFRERLPLYGHRNWIVVADSAYPAQARAGIETIVSGREQMEVIRIVLDELSAARHVRPVVWLDRELSEVPEADAPGITAYRTQIAALLKGRDSQLLPHGQIISKLDATAQTFRVLIIKTNSVLPYTSVFLQLEAGYWSADAEKRLRRSINR